MKKLLFVFLLTQLGFVSQVWATAGTEIPASKFVDLTTPEFDNSNIYIYQTQILAMDTRRTIQGVEITSRYVFRDIQPFLQRQCATNVGWLMFHVRVGIHGKLKHPFLNAHQHLYHHGQDKVPKKHLYL